MYNKDNIFRKIIEGSLDSEKIYEDDKILAFKDKYPTAPIHVLVIPKGKFTSFVDFSEKTDADEIGNFFKKIRQIAEDLGLNKNGYRLVTNHGHDANQVVDHFHIHILGGGKL